MSIVEEIVQAMRAKGAADEQIAKSLGQLRRVYELSSVCFVIRPGGAEMGKDEQAAVVAECDRWIAKLT